MLKLIASEYALSLRAHFPFILSFYFGLYIPCLKDNKLKSLENKSITLLFDAEVTNIRISGGH